MCYTKQEGKQFFSFVPNFVFLWLLLTVELSGSHLELL